MSDATDTTGANPEADIPALKRPLEGESPVASKMQTTSGNEQESAQDRKLRERKQGLETGILAAIDTMIAITEAIPDHEVYMERRKNQDLTGSYKDYDIRRALLNPTDHPHLYEHHYKPLKEPVSMRDLFTSRDVRSGCVPPVQIIPTSEFIFNSQVSLTNQFFNARWTSNSYNSCRETLVSSDRDLIFLKSLRENVPNHLDEWVTIFPKRLANIRPTLAQILNVLFLTTPVPSPITIRVVEQDVHVGSKVLNSARLNDEERQYRKDMFRYELAARVRASSSNTYTTIFGDDSDSDDSDESDDFATVSLAAKPSKSTLNSMPSAPTPPEYPPASPDDVLLVDPSGFIIQSPRIIKDQTLELPKDTQMPIVFLSNMTGSGKTFTMLCTLVWLLRSKAAIAAVERLNKETRVPVGSGLFQVKPASKVVKCAFCVVPSTIKQQFIDVAQKFFKSFPGEFTIRIDGIAEASLKDIAWMDIPTIWIAGNSRYVTDFLERSKKDGYRHLVQWDDEFNEMNGRQGVTSNDLAKPIFPIYITNATLETVSAMSKRKTSLCATAYGHPEFNMANVHTSICMELATLPGALIEYTNTTAFALMPSATKSSVLPIIGTERSKKIFKIGDPPSPIAPIQLSKWFAEIVQQGKFSEEVWKGFLKRLQSMPTIEDLVPLFEEILSKLDPDTQHSTRSKVRRYIMLIENIKAEGTFECPVFLTDYGADQVIVLPCCAQFLSKEAAEGCMRLSRRCPLCRKPSAQFDIKLFDKEADDANAAAMAQYERKKAAIKAKMEAFNNRFNSFSFTSMKDEDEALANLAERRLPVVRALELLFRTIFFFNTSARVIISIKNPSQYKEILAPLIDCVQVENRKNGWPEVDGLLVCSHSHSIGKKFTSKIPGTNVLMSDAYNDRGGYRHPMILVLNSGNDSKSAGLDAPTTTHVIFPDNWISPSLKAQLVGRMIRISKPGSKVSNSCIKRMIEFTESRTPVV